MLLKVFRNLRDFNQLIHYFIRCYPEDYISFQAILQTGTSVVSHSLSLLVLLFLDLNLQPLNKTRLIRVFVYGWERGIPLLSPLDVKRSKPSNHIHPNISSGGHHPSRLRENSPKTSQVVFVILTRQNYQDSLQLGLLKPCRSCQLQVLIPWRSGLYQYQKGRILTTNLGGVTLCLGGTYETKE